jgi:hypothetical protein
MPFSPSTDQRLFLAAQQEDQLSMLDSGEDNSPSDEDYKTGYGTPADDARMDSHPSTKTEVGGDETLPTASERRVDTSPIDQHQRTIDSYGVR